MKYIFYTNIVSPHQLPWCREFVKLVGVENFLYIAEEPLHEERKSLGWNNGKEPWIRELSDAEKFSDGKPESCDVLITSLRKADLLRKRAAKGLLSYYMFERWFKPPAGSLRMFHPGYYKLCRDFDSLLESRYIRFLPVGIYAAEDMHKLHKLLKNPFSRSGRGGSSDSRYAPMQMLNPENMRMWGYFVEPGSGIHSVSDSKELSLFWCGRMLDWKRVDTLVKAAVFLLERNLPLNLTMVGHGPEEGKLRKMAGKWLDKKIFFKPPAKIEKIRQYMRTGDVYILASDGGEGWGAALNEAMNEGMIPVGTYEAGSSATMIRHGENGFLYHSGNVGELADILSEIRFLKQSGKDSEIRNNALQTIHAVWSPENAAKALFEDCCGRVKK